MPTLQIHDLEPQHAVVVDPRLLLPMLGERAIQASWQVAGVAHYDEALMIVGDEEAERLENLAQSSERISGALLRDLLSRVSQVIWGEFRAYEADRDTPWAIVRAIDSSWCEVETDDAGILGHIRQIFVDVRENP